MGKTLNTKNCRFTFTVFIPTYNRAHTLGRALQSIEDQTFDDLEVLIIDDGSTDTTRSLVDKWRKKAHFPIQYYWQKNQGKHVAHNNALQRAKGFFFVLLDSDDMLHPRALERLKYHWDTIPDDDKPFFAGVEGLCVDSRGNVSRDKYPFDVMDSNYLEIAKKYNIMGDKKNAIRTEILRQFPYPHFQGERHMRDDLIWKRISMRYKFRYINEPIQIIEYQPDGLSADVFSMRMRNPQGFRYYYLEEINTYSALTRRYLRFKYHAKFVRYSLHCGVGFFQQYREVRSKFLWLISVPRGVIGWLEDRAKMFHRKL
ncbi:MAG: glycosyltransferase family 2 protein [Deltaproteobacteria bacterium]|nr:MAG: glycosyltransferase family 2 protein [Deltaproteobacteria bacterium]